MPQQGPYQPPPPNYHPAQPVPSGRTPGYQPAPQPQPVPQQGPYQPAPPPPGQGQGHQAHPVPGGPQGTPPGQRSPGYTPPANGQAHPGGPAYTPPAGGGQAQAQAAALAWANSHGMAGAYVKKAQQKGGNWEFMLRAPGGPGHSENKATVVVDGSGTVRSGQMKTRGGPGWNDDE